MRGGVVHNGVLVQPLATTACSLGARVNTEVAVTTGRSTGYADLLIERDGFRLLVEAELSPRRLAGDLRKARDLDADRLWIVVPNQPMARRARRAVKREQERSGGPRVRACVLTLGQALHRLERYFPLISGANVLRKTIP